MTAADPMDTAAQAAVRQSVFGTLPAALLGRVLEDHRDVSVTPGYRFRGADHPPRYRTGLVVAGLLRMFVEATDGRQVNFRYAGPGYFLGAATTVGGLALEVSTGVEAVTAARVLYLDLDRLRTLARSETDVAWALLAQQNVYQRDLVHVLAGTAFGSIRQRVAMHLLDLGAAGLARPEALAEPLVPVTQQALADAVGTTRETVAKALGALRDIGAIATGRAGVALLDLQLLAAEARAATRG